MIVFRWLWPFGHWHQERAAYKKKVESEFQAQLKEALLRQKDLKAAAKRLQTEREIRRGQNPSLASIEELGIKL